MMMDVTTTRSGTNAAVSVTGDVDSETAPALAQEVEELLAAGVSGLSMDLSGVTFLSSAGLSVLIDARKRSTEFRLIRGNRLVDRLVSLTGLEILYGEEANDGVTDGMGSAGHGAGR
jgi:anti-sigma B factor antagonist